MSVITKESLLGRKWEAIVNGKKSMNGKWFAKTFTGTVDEISGDSPHFSEFFTEMLDEVAGQCEDMEYVDSFSFTLFPSEAVMFAEASKN